MELEIQKYLRAGNSFEQLEKDYSISAKQHSRCPSLFLFKYNQISSPFFEKIVQECRGIVLDKDDNWNVVACPYFKFFNYSEPLSAPIDWSTARVQEKLDGSLITLYYCYGRWHVATSGCPDGTNQVGDFNTTFDTLFWECFCNQGLFTNKLYRTYTYMWELTSPLNRVVVNYTESKVTLIGVRSNIDLQERPVSDFSDILPVVQEYPLKTVEECLNAADNLDPLKSEGLVCVDSSFNRIKIKSLAYITLHHLKDSCSLSKMAEIIRNGEYQEFSIALDTYPEIKVKFLELVNKYEEIVKQSILAYSLISDIKDQKEFALKALKVPHNTILFFMRKTGKTPQAIIKDMTGPAYLRLLGVK